MRLRVVAAALAALFISVAGAAQAETTNAARAKRHLPFPRSPVLSSRGTVVPTAALPDDEYLGTFDIGPFFQGGALSYRGIVEAGARATLIGTTVVDGMMMDLTLKAQVWQARHFRLALRAGRFDWTGREVGDEHALYAGVTASLCFDEECASSFSAGGLAARATDELAAGPRRYGLVTPNAVLLVTPYVSRFGAVHVMAEAQRLPVGERYRDSWVGSVGARLAWQRAFVDFALMGYLEAIHPEGVDLRKVPYLQVGLRL